MRSQSTTHVTMVCRSKPSVAFTVCLGKQSRIAMPTAARNIEANYTRGAALDSYAIRTGRHRVETYTTRTRCSKALSAEGPAARPSKSPTSTHNHSLAVVHRLHNPRARTPIHPKGDRRDCPAWFCVRTHIKNHVVPSRSNSKRPCTSKFIWSQVKKITLQCFALAKLVLPSWSVSVK